MRLIDKEFNPVTGLTTEYWSHDGGRKVTIRVVQDVEPLLDQNARELNAKSSKSRVGISEGLGTKVASIPMGVVEKLAKEGLNVITCSEARLKALLNDPEYSKLRTAHGRL